MTDPNRWLAVVEHTLDAKNSSTVHLSDGGCAVAILHMTTSRAHSLAEQVNQERPAPPGVLALADGTRIARGADIPDGWERRMAGGSWRWSGADAETLYEVRPIAERPHSCHPDRPESNGCARCAYEATR